MKYFLALILIMLSVLLTAMPVDRQTAEKAAQNWTAQMAPQNFASRNVEKVITFGDKAGTDLFLFLYKNGFVLTSADDAVKPILAYGYDTIVNEPTANPSFSEQIAVLQEEIRGIRTSRTDNAETSAQWQAVLSHTFERENTRSIAPLISTKWNQDWPYNMYCPADAAGPGGHVYAGCVATAMGQVMKYWNWPTTGIGSHNYYAQGYGSQSANFGATTYQWAQMPNQVHEANEAVARLLQHCGISVDMMYAADGSGAYSADVADAWIQNFRYNPSLQYKMKSSFSSATWEQMLRTELDNARPMYYSGNGPGGGHAFNCDGYQNTNYFHFNWGWSGSYDGYYYVSNLNPGYTFNNYQGAIFNVYPMNYSMSTVQMSLQGEDCSVGDLTTLSVVSYPLLPEWNVSSLSFSVQFDDTYMSYIGFNTTGTMLDGSNLTANLIQPGLVTFTAGLNGTLSGGGTLLKLQFQPQIPGNFAFSLADFNLNSTAVTLLGSVSINASALVNDVQYSVIDMLNAMHVNYNDIAVIPVTTTFILPTWNVTTAGFTLHYPASQLQWEGFDASNCLAQTAVVEVTPNGEGVLHFSMGFSGQLVGSGNLLQLRFRSIGNIGSVSLATLTLTDFFYNQTSISNLQPGYIVMMPVTANDDNNVVSVNSLTMGPNPFSTASTLTLSLAKVNQQADITVYNLKGQAVKTLYRSDLKGNSLSLVWNGTDDSGKAVPAGIYFVRTQSEGFSQTFKLIRLK